MSINVILHVVRFSYFLFVYSEAESLTAFRCLAHFLVTKKKKAGSDPEATSVDIPHILMEGKVNITAILVS